MSLRALKSEVAKTTIAYCEAEKGKKSEAAFIKASKAWMEYSIAFNKAKKK